MMIKTSFRKMMMLMMMMMLMLHLVAAGTGPSLVNPWYGGKRPFAVPSYSLSLQRQQQQEQPRQQQHQQRQQQNWCNQEIRTATSPSSSSFSSFITKYVVLQLRGGNVGGILSMLVRTLRKNPLLLLRK